LSQGGQFAYPVLCCHRSYPRGPASLQGL